MVVAGIFCSINEQVLHESERPTHLDWQSSDPGASKTAADKGKMHLETKATKPVLEASEADKGKQRNGF